MFVTSASQEVPLLRGLAPTEVRLWTAVEMGLEVPWFHATFWFHDGEENRVRSLLTASYNELTAPRMDERWHALINVQLVSPGWLNQTGAWRMDPLSEIRVGDFTNGQTFLYLLANGEWLTGPGVTIQQATNQETLFFLKRTP